MSGPQDENPEGPRWQRFQVATVIAASLSPNADNTVERSTGSGCAAAIGRAAAEKLAGMSATTRSAMKRRRNISFGLSGIEEILSPRRRTLLHHAIRARSAMFD